MICHEKYFAWVNVFTFLTYEEILQNKANAKCRTNGLQNKKQAGVVMMESSTKETFAKPGYIKTHSIFVEHSLNKKGFSFSISVEQTQTVNNKQKTKLYDWNFLRFAENIFFCLSFWDLLWLHIMQLRSSKWHDLFVCGSSPRQNSSLQ